MNDDWTQVQQIIADWALTSQEVQAISPLACKDSDGIVFKTDGSPQEMLRISKDGFYVRGVKVEQDDREAELVYNNFKQWLTWAQLNRN